MPNPKKPLGLLAVLAALALLAGCSGGGSAARDSAVEPAAPQGEEGRAGAGQQKGTTGGTGKAGATTNPTSDEQLLTYTATLRVRVDDPAAKATAAEKVVTKAGGYVERQNQTGEGSSSAYATTTFRVPSAKYRDVLDRLGKLGERTSLTQQTDNVTQRVADVDARIKSAKASLERLRTLLGKATDVDDLVTIEAEISRREADLESLQATQRTLAEQVEYATITLKLSTRPDTEDEEQAGFLTGLRAGWHAFVAFLTGVATVAGTLLPFLILVAPAAAVGYLVWRRRRRRPAAETPTS